MLLHHPNTHMLGDTKGLCICISTVRITQGMTGGHGLGVACGHIKILSFPHQRKICAEGLQG